MRIFVICFLLIAIGCQTPSPKKLRPQDLLINENEKILHPSTLSSEEASADSQFLIYTLENGYGGRNFIPEGLFPKAINKIKEINGPLKIEDFKNRIDEALLVIPDNHLNARLNGEASPARKASVRLSTVGANAISDKNRTWEVRNIPIGPKKALYISITTFPSEKDKVWTGFLEEVSKRLLKSDAVIIDLRGNNGGDDAYGRKLAFVLYGQDPPDPFTKEYVSQTPETIAIHANYYRLHSLVLKRDGKEVSPYFDEIYQEIMIEFPQALNKEIPTEKVIVRNNQALKTSPSYTKLIYVLIDNSCISSCEGTVALLEGHPSVITVGENTSGTIHFGDIGFVLLPNSKIAVQIPTTYHERSDGRFIERIGISPKIMVPSGQDALKFTISKLKFNERN